MTKKEMAALGARIKERRLELGLSVKELAEAVRVCDAAIYNWERGKKRPKPEIAVRLSKALKCSVEEVFPEWHDLSTLARVMALKGVTQREVAQAMGVRLTEINSVVLSRCTPSIEYAN